MQALPESERQKIILSEPNFYAWNWAESLVGGPPPGDSPFVSDEPVSVRGIEECSQLLPRHAMASDPSPALNGTDVVLNPAWAPVWVVGPDGEPQQQQQAQGEAAAPVLVWVPYYGLGNSLRGFCSSFVFAVLSGRHLLRWHGGSSKGVLDILCTAFNCHVGQLLNFTGNFGTAGIHQLKTFHMERHPLSHISDTNHPALYAATPIFFDGGWTHHVELQRCMLAAFRCTTLWCVHTRAVRHLLGGGPTPALGRMMERVIVKVGGDASGGGGAAGGGGDGSGGGGAGGSGAAVGEWVRLEEGTALRLQFDVAIHLRTQNRAFEHHCHKGKDCSWAGMGQYVSFGSWRCICDLLRHLQLRKSGVNGPLSSANYSSSSEPPPGVTLKPLYIFFATDFEAGRASILEYLKPYGEVYFSRGKVTHSMKDLGGDVHAEEADASTALVTAAEFYLMSRARWIVGFGHIPSTFSLFAAVYSNATLLHRLSPVGQACHFQFDNRARVLRPPGQ